MQKDEMKEMLGDKFFDDLGTAHALFLEMKENHSPAIAYMLMAVIGVYLHGFALVCKKDYPDKILPEAESISEMFKCLSSITEVLYENRHGWAVDVFEDYEDEIINATVH